MTFDREKYRLFLEEWTSGKADIERWLAVGEALGARPGWRYGVAGCPEWIAWMYGEGGESRLTVTAELGGGLVMHEANGDREIRVGKLERLLVWLEDHEHEYAGPSPLHDELREDLEAGP